MYLKYSQDISLKLSQDEAYALLTLLVPILLDPDYEIDPDLLPLLDEESIPLFMLMGYLSPLLSLMETAESFRKVHSFDTEIRRLKELVYGPPVKRIVDKAELSYRFPCAGDAVDEETKPQVPADALYHVEYSYIERVTEDGTEEVDGIVPAEDLILRMELYANEDNVFFLADESWNYLGTVFINGEEIDASGFFSGTLTNDEEDSEVGFLIVEIPFTPEEPQPEKPQPVEPVMPVIKPYPTFPIRIPIPQNPAVSGAGRFETEPVPNIPGQPEAPAGSTVSAAETPAAEEPVLPFTDVAAGNPWLNGIRYVYESGTMNGVSGAEFDPQGTLTRAMLVTILGRMEQIGPEAYDTVSFTDVDHIGTWNYAPYVEWAARNGIVLGYGDGTFGPMDPVTCEQAVLMLQRYARYLGYDADAESACNEEGVSEWAAGAVAWSMENGVYAEADGLPCDPACRGWMAQTIYGFVGFLIR